MLTIKGLLLSILIISCVLAGFLFMREYPYRSVAIGFFAVWYCCSQWGKLMGDNTIDMDKKE